MNRLVCDNVSDAAPLTSLSTSVMYRLISDTCVSCKDEYYIDKQIGAVRVHTMSRHFCSGQSMSLLFNFAMVCACA